MNRPRKSNRKHWPDYLNARKKPGGLYYSWKHPHTGKEYGLGYSFQTAAAEAREANLRILSTKEPRATLSDRIENKDQQTMSAWLDIFAAKLAKRKSKKRGGGLRAESTMAIDARMIAVFRDWFKDALIAKIETKDCAALLQSYRDKGHDRQAVNVRSYLVDCFNEAEASGWIPRGTNPAEILKADAPDTKRNRLTIEHFKKIIEASEGWPRIAFILALITGQRVSDIANMKYDDVRGGFIYVQQIKTGDRIKIPLELELIGYSLRSIIKESRKIVGAKTIVHQDKKTARSQPGEAIESASISRKFTELVREHLPKFKQGTPPTFHEIRALSKSLHMAHGIDTLALLGHDDESSARAYSDPRQGWVEVKIPAIGR